jgi:hypothetical protein
MLPVLVALGLTMGALIPASTFGQAHSAGVVKVEGATETFQVRDWNGQEVEVNIPSRSLQDIRMGNGGPGTMSRTTARANRTVDATVVSIDGLRNTITVRTQYGQIIVLATPTQDLQVGEKLILEAR